MYFSAMPVSQPFWSLESLLQLGFLVLATAGLVLWVMQWHHARRLPKPFPGWLRALTGAFAVFALGNWIWSIGHSAPWAQAAPWLLGSSVAMLFALLALHRKGMQRIVSQTIPTTDGRFIEEIILAQSLAQIQRNTALQETLRKAKREHLRSQMNPHFLFNVLTGIQHLIMQDETERASDLFRRFRHLLMQGFLTGESSTGTLEQELEHVESYLELEAIRVTNPIEWTLDVHTDVDPGNTPCPLFLIQPLVENAIWHGLDGGQTQAPAIRIAIQWENDEDLVIRVEDNGRGLGAHSNPQKNHTSRGTSIVRERLALLPQGGELSIENRWSLPLASPGAVSTLRLFQWRSYALHAAGA